jgi:hypothetical protein
VPRFAKITAAQEREELEQQLERPALLRLRTIFRPHVPNDVPGRVCWCCGSPWNWALGSEDDLEVLVSSRRQVRRNAWEIMTPEGRALFREQADAAQPWGTVGAACWDVPIVFTCGEQQVEQIRDDETMTLLWSGGWRSMKSHTASQWWSRGWVRFGSQGELFWLMGPQEITAFRLMERIFYGRGRSEDGKPKRSPPILPCYPDPETGEPRSMVAHGLPRKVGQRDPAFHFVDGSKVEIRHTMNDAGLEGDDVRRILGDEAVRWRSKTSYQIALGRVTQCSGQIGLATVPDEEGEWVYDEIVAPCEQQMPGSRRVFTLPTTGNLWLAPASAERLRLQCVDETMLTEKFKGEWTRAGMFAWSEQFKPGEHVLDVIGHSPESWGFEHDVTRQAVRGLFKGKERDYLGVRDFNFAPQTGLVAKVFATDPRDRLSWHLVIVDEHLEKGDARHAADAFVRQFRGGRYAPVDQGGHRRGPGLICDRNGFWDGHRYGGRPSKTSDAFEFQAAGCLVRPPLWTPTQRGTRGKAYGHEAENPGDSDSKKLVRKLLGEGRILIDSVCTRLVAAIPRVPRRQKGRNEANTAMDKQIYNFGDCLRYLAWVLFAEEVPHKPRARGRIAGARPLGAKHVDPRNVR